MEKIPFEMDPKYEASKFSSAPPLRTFIKWSLVSFVFLTLIGMWLAEILLEERREAVEQNIEQRVEILSQGKADIVRLWADNLAEIARPIATSDLIGLYMVDATQKGQLDAETQEALQAQTPYMQQMLKESAEKYNMVAAKLVNPKGETVVGTDATNPSLNQQEGMRKAMVHGNPRVMNIRRNTESGLVLDVAYPIQAPQSDEYVGTLLMTMPVMTKLDTFMSRGALGEEGERAYLVQNEAKDALYVVQQNELIPLSPDQDLPAQKRGLDKSMVDQLDVFYSLTHVPDSDFIIMQEHIAKDALVPYTTYKGSLISIITLGMLLVLSLILGVVWHLMGVRNRVRVRLQEQSIAALLRAIEIRDPYLAGHHTRLAKLSIKIGQRLGLGVGARSTLFYASLLSGVGKIFVPENLLTKKGKHTKDERHEMQQHVNHAMNVLGDLEFDLPVAAVVHQMHERLDGTGYPNGLSGDAIHPLAKILGACDAYCAMIEPRSYRECLPPKKALEELKSDMAGYDPKVVKALEDHINEECQKAREAA